MGEQKDRMLRGEWYRLLNGLLGKVGPGPGPDAVCPGVTIDENTVIGAGSEALHPDSGM